MLIIVSAALALATASLADVPRSVSLTAVPSLPQSLLAQAGETDIIETNDGKALVGKIVDENSKGYLFRDQGGKTQLIEYANVKSVRRGSAGAQSSGGPPPPPPAAAPPVDVQTTLAEIENIDFEIRRLEKQRLEYPLGGYRALAVLSAISFAGMMTMGFMFAPSAGYPESGGFAFLAALGFIMSAVFVAVFILSVALVGKNAPKNRELVDRIQRLEERKERIIELNQRRGAREPQPLNNPLLTVSL